jgi:hypothetical protein
MSEILPPAFTRNDERLAAAWPQGGAPGQLVSGHETGAADSARRQFEARRSPGDGARRPARGHSLDGAQDRAVAVQEEHVNWKPHAESVHTVDA